MVVRSVERGSFAEEMGLLAGDRIDVLSEKKSYQPGEVARFQVRSPSGRTPLNPEDRVAVGRFEEEGEMGADFGGTPAEAAGLFDTFEVVELCRVHGGVGIEVVHRAHCSVLVAR